MSACPECGGVCVSIVDGSSLVLRCTCCEWSVATTNHDHPAFDQTPYAVLVTAPTLERRTFVAVLAAESGLRISDARSIVDESRPIATNVSATEVYRLHRLLHPRGIVLTTEPAFPWSLNERP